MDDVNKRVFLSIEIGLVYIYSIISYKDIILLNTIQVNNRMYIHKMLINFENQYLFNCSFDGNISVVTLDHPGKERFIKEISIYNLEYKVINLKKDKLFYI